MSTSTPHRILLAVVLAPDGMLSIAHMACVLNVQTRVSTLSDHHTTIGVYESVEDVKTEFQGGAYDWVCCVRSDKSVGPEFVFQPPEAPCTIAPYPLPRVRWDLLDQETADPAVAERSTHEFNVSSLAENVPREDVRESHVFKCKAGHWIDEEPVLRVDLRHPAVSSGLLCFTGCVGHRKVLRC